MGSFGILVTPVSHSEMGRPAASEANKQFAVALAHMVTHRTDNPSDTIARCGKCSVFALLKMFCPGVVRDCNTSPRDGISEVELNKALQVCKLLPTSPFFFAVKK